MSKPYLFLDIDGVLSPFAPHDKTKPIPGHEYTLWVPHHSNWLKALQSQYDLVWASFWEKAGNQIFSSLYEMDPLPIVKFTDENCFRLPYHKKTIKLQAIEEFADERPLAWIDDDLRADAFIWAEKRDKLSPTLLVRTDPNIGLDESARIRLEEWAKNLQ